MKLVIQRVKSASVLVQKTKKKAGSIDRGLFVLVGIAGSDTEHNVEVLAQKLAKLRIMADQNDKMNLSIADAKASLLIVSQFTLYADTASGNRPSFIKAAPPDKARQLYEYFVAKLKGMGHTVQTGSFGDYMEISANLDGPVTILLES